MACLSVWIGPFRQESNQNSWVNHLKLPETPLALSKEQKTVLEIAAVAAKVNTAQKFVGNVPECKEQKIVHETVVVAVVADKKKRLLARNLWI